MLWVVSLWILSKHYHWSSACTIVTGILCLLTPLWCLIILGIWVDLDRLLILVSHLHFECIEQALDVEWVCILGRHHLDVSSTKGGSHVLRILVIA
jgi:hypothetical protein